MASFNEVEFRRRVQEALEASKVVLSNARAPHYLADAPHNWEDSFLLVRSLTNVLISAQLKALETVGLTDKQLTIMKDWSCTRNVTMRFKVEETCEFVREVQREVESATKAVTANTVLGTTQSYTVTKVTEFFWSLQRNCQIVVYAGTSVEQAIVLCQHLNSTEIKTATQKSPRPARSMPSPHDVNITWLLQHIDERFNASFDIDRQSPSCHTPRRNADSEAALAFVPKIGLWYGMVFSYMLDNTFITREDTFVSDTLPIVRELEKGAISISSANIHTTICASRWQLLTLRR